MKNLSEDQKHAKEKIAILEDFLAYLLEQPHNFWHCAAQDDEHKMPFYYYQRNLMRNMSTCGVCNKAIEIKRQIIKIQKKSGLPVMELRTSFTSDVKIRVSASGGQYDPNRAFLGR